MEIQRPQEGCIRFIEEGEYTVDMTIADDCKGFEIKITSATSMTPSNIVDALEDFLYDNILDGYDPEEPTQ
jgi:hypothetical protein